MFPDLTKTIIGFFMNTVQARFFTFCIIITLLQVYQFIPGLMTLTLFQCHSYIKKILVLTDIKKIWHSMLCVTGVYLRDITNMIFVILHVSHLRICCSCFLWKEMKMNCCLRNLAWLTLIRCLLQHEVCCPVVNVCRF